MKQLLAFLGVIVCLGFIPGKKAPLNPDLIVGKWKFEKSTTDGVTDTSRQEFSEAYFIFTKDSFYEVLMLWRGDTAIIPGIYSINAKRKTLTTDGNDKPIDVDLTATTLVFFYTGRFQNGPRRKYSNHYLKVN
jgi:hypothetical protein